ncbi:hypothetical protein PRZ48_009294 [Zasmidium cellare]|uniref:BTB domain-containing protein n=1 Tax=Zasmidium cellare TaxID=395010 RepID=A0ABR0EBB8_ZASCE|nr:hypothetical protein PRZ48_009294 [Zasmidium cellare]
MVYVNCLNCTNSIQPGNSVHHVNSVAIADPSNYYLQTPCFEMAHAAQILSPTGESFIIKSFKGPPYQVPIAILSIYSPVLQKMATSPSFRLKEYREGHVEINGKQETSIKAMVDFLRHGDERWWNVAVDDRALHAVELYNLAEQFEIRDLRANLLSSFARWTSPRGATDDDGLRRARNAVKAVLGMWNQVPVQLRQAMAREWANAMTGEHSRELEDVVGLHSEFASAVRDEDIWRS